MTKDPRLLDLFVEGLGLLYAAHHQGGEQARQNIDSSSLPKLKWMLKAGSELNLIQAKRLEPIFKSLGRDIEKRTDQAMGGIAEANRTLVTEVDGLAMRDLANIGSGQIAAHFYISTYGTLRAYAKALGLRDAMAIFDQTSAETRKIDLALTALAARIIAASGNNAYPHESAFYTTAALHPVRTAAAGFALVAAGAATFMVLMPPATSTLRGVRRLRSH